MSGAAGDVEISGAPGAIPELIRSAGDAAVRAYREFLEDTRLSENTRGDYGQWVRRFFRWAKGREYAARLLASGVWLPNGRIDVSGDDSECGATEHEDLEALNMMINVSIAIGHDERKAVAERDSLAGEELSAVDGVADA